MTIPSSAAAWHRCLISTLLIFLCTSAALTAQRPPSSSEIGKLIKRWNQLAPRDAKDQKEAATILTRLDEGPPLTKRQAQDWRKKIVKSWKKGRKIEKKGRNYFWEKEKRGLYYVGGKTKKPKGLLIGLHGGGKGSGDAGSSFGMYQSAANKLGWVLVCPEVLVKSEHGWTTDGTEEFVLDLVNAALRTWKIDRDHVYFAGHSMGGYGSWTMGAHHADRLAALAPSAGAPTPLKNQKEEIIGIIEGVIPNLRNLRMIIFQSIDDPRVPPGPNQAATRLLGEAKEKNGGYDYEYWEVDGLGHGLPKGGAMALLEKIKDAARNPIPKRITWQPTLKWKQQFYWLYWSNPFVNTELRADLDGDKNEIRIECKDARNGLQVLLDERMVDMKKEVVIIVNDIERYRGVPERRLSTMLMTSRSVDSKLMFDARIVLDIPQAGG